MEKECEKCQHKSGTGPRLSTFEFGGHANLAGLSLLDIKGFTRQSYILSRMAYN